MEQFSKLSKEDIGKKVIRKGLTSIHSFHTLVEVCDNFVKIKNDMSLDINTLINDDQWMIINEYKFINDGIYRTALKYFIYKDSVSPDVKLRFNINNLNSYARFLNKNDIGKQIIKEELTLRNNEHTEYYNANDYYSHNLITFTGIDTYYIYYYNNVGCGQIINFNQKWIVLDKEFENANKVDYFLKVFPSLTLVDASAKDHSLWKRVLNEFFTIQIDYTKIFI